MKFKLATSPATNLKQCSERKPKRKEKQRGVCVETHSVCARERQRAREAKQGRDEVASRGFRSHLWGSITEQKGLQGEVLGAQSSSLV